MDRSEKRAKAEAEYSSLVVEVAGRQALPVRAIPYVSGWNLSPDEVAKQFARDVSPGFEKLANTDTYHMQYDSVVKLLPKEWDPYVAALQGLERELKEQFTSDDQGYAAWLSRSVAKLPSGVFVWLDEFTADFDRFYRRLAIIGERQGDRDLNLSPYLDNEALNLVLVGFGSRSPFPTHSGIDHIAQLGELILNGHPIDWKHWVHSMPTLSARDAVRLMVGLDPDLYHNLEESPVLANDTSRARALAKKMERLALAQADERRSPEAWCRWAQEHDFEVHSGYFLAARGRYLSENEAEVLEALPRAEARIWEQAPSHGPRERLISRTYAVTVSTVALNFPEFCAELEERLARWRRGRYLLIEAAQVLADQHADVVGDARSLAEQMDDALHGGQLAYRRNNIKVAPKRIPQERLWHRDVFQEDVNEWLAASACGNEVRLAYPYPDAPTRSPRHTGTPGFDWAVLATRDQLAVAFGAFTGLNVAWFKNLKDTPALRAARKVVGRGQRGSTVEPWFCPFEVMLWLVNPKRKKGRRLSEEKGWDLLERHFPKVYALKQIADPRFGQGK
jgi:hypothetical protein